ncbi:hypothetical protein MKK60_19015, partial [Methylobacterium sp. J-092]|nr:hypothetical protein [Methylobacterium sp. J-092]
MRDSFREAVARNGSARPIVSYQCAQANDAVRKSIVDAFTCDFPVLPAASETLLQTPPPASAGRAPAQA